MKVAEVNFAITVIKEITLDILIALEFYLFIYFPKEMLQVFLFLFPYGKLF